jgi:hypothetical protein
MKKLLSLTAMFLWASMVAMTPAHAVPTLNLWDGVNPATVVADQGALDSNALVGVVTYMGPVGAWLVNVSTGITQPVLGSTKTASMDLNSVDVYFGPAGGNLTIKFTETGYLLAGGTQSAAMNIGGTTFGNVTYSAYYDNNNVPFALTTLIGTLGPFVTPAFSGSLTPATLTSNPFSLTQVVTLQQNVTGSTSFDAGVNVTAPIPSAGFLMGSGLLWLLGFRRKPTT